MVSRLDALYGASTCVLGLFYDCGVSVGMSVGDVSGVARVPLAVYSLAEHGRDFVSKVVDAMRLYNGYELVVDDVGMESTYGGKREDDVLARVIAVRECSPCRTHFTGNLTKAALDARYDERVRSRLKGCAWIPMVGADNREALPNAQEVAFANACADSANWHLCADRCANVAKGGVGCARGVRIPPEIAKPSPYPPQDCPCFVSNGKEGEW